MDAKTYGGYTIAQLRQFIAHTFDTEHGGDSIDDLTHDGAASANIIRDLLDALPSDSAQASVPDETIVDAFDKAGVELLPGRGNINRVIAATRALLAAPVAPAARPTDDELWDQTLSERDEYHEMADKLAAAIAAHLGVDIGEHSNANDPWEEALEAIENVAPAATAPTVPQAVLDALRFYAHGHHYTIDEDHQQFDTVSGEPQNWLCSERDDDCTMIEDGSIARSALCGGILGFEEGTVPLDGEVLLAAPTPTVDPAAAAPIPESIQRDLERTDWTPEEALRWYADGKHFDVVNRRTRILDTGAIASCALKRTNAEYHGMKGADASFPFDGVPALNEQREAIKKAALMLKIFAGHDSGANLLHHFGKDWHDHANKHAATLRALLAAPTPTVAADAAAPITREATDE
ncbi:hypothetical protein [Paraburkholderia silvatlantica]|uniref:Uncharacterized protein n=1 Tax=Paraburkholderia silvatlantica TaxID=321895 RepID=A0ABR6FP29_9BURK|nr:hypothetical protein [Paraburkholderia silvatlantica]MBB2928349.1 hypothetical protein [Paraburkholderia silvatlantica]PVY34604.1 hypothetical protein C7411_107140 [Paraburkholderia silvatlantica]PXW38819.1 hypothetical protein C7413_107140 [Paraburkholderia silvatlantica]